MSPNGMPSWILGGTLLITAASTLGGCASMPLANSASTEKAGPPQEISGSINPTPSEPDLWHVLRSAMEDLHDAGIAFYPFLMGSISIRTTP